jgi:putative glutamine amidotransferase
MGSRVVGITCGTSKEQATGVPRQILNRAYVWAVERAGGVPVILPVTADQAVISRYLGLIDGLLLTGGVDISPGAYGQPDHPKLGEVDADRDATELPLITEAVAQNLPIFAICRGIQALNVALGGTLYQDLPSEHPSAIEHQQRNKHMARDQFSHDIRIEAGSRLHQIVDDTEMRCNSLHHQALKEVAPGLVVTARASDGVIEAVEHPEQRYLVAVQFHPEETAPHDATSRRLFETFISVL